MVNIFKDPTPTPAPAGEPIKHFILTGDNITLSLCGLASNDALTIMVPLQVTCVKCLQTIDDLARASNFTQATEIASNVTNTPENIIGNEEDIFYRNMTNFRFVTESEEPEEEYLTKLANIRDNL